METNDTHHHHPQDEHPQPGRPSTGGPAFDGTWWEQHYRSAAGTAIGDPTPYVLALGPGSGRTALDVGCGTGADAVWLARQGWRVTAVDIAPTAIAQARAAAAEQAPDLAEQITWTADDVLAWTPERRYDLVASQYVHPDAPYERFVARLASLVAEGGTLLVVGHDHTDAHSTAHAPRDASLGAAAVTSALDPQRWVVELAETRERHLDRDGDELVLTDTVVRAHRR